MQLEHWMTKIFIFLIPTDSKCSSLFCFSKICLRLVSPWWFDARKKVLVMTSFFFSNACWLNCRMDPRIVTNMVHKSMYVWGNIALLINSNKVFTPFSCTSFKFGYICTRKLRYWLGNHCVQSKKLIPQMLNSLALRCFKSLVECQCVLVPWAFQDLSVNEILIPWKTVQCRTQSQGSQETTRSDWMCLYRVKFLDENVFTSSIASCLRSSTINKSMITSETRKNKCNNNILQWNGWK